MDEEQAERFRLATLSLRLDQAIKELEEVKAQKDPATIRDIAICWAFFASALAAIQSAARLMPPTVLADMHVQVMAQAIEGVVDALGAVLEEVDKKKE